MSPTYRLRKIPLPPLLVSALVLAACTPMRSRGTGGGGGGPEIHGEIKTSAGGSVGGMAAVPSKAPDLTEAFEAPPGCAVTLFAESPAVRNPTAMDVDARGRVWVTEAVNYRQWDGRNPGAHEEKGDRVVILEDADGDGVAESSKTFVQDEDLVAPLGIAVLGDARDPKVTRVYVSCSPTIWLYTDTNGDDVPDSKEVFLTGFGGHDHDHGVHSIVVGPDGRFYIAVGNAGPHIVTDRSGWTLRSGSIYCGGGEEEADNHPALVSDDGKVWVGGLILRCEPDGSKLTVMAHNFRNQYEVALDSFGNMFTADNDDDGNECCRTCWVMEGGNYGYFSADGSRDWHADRRPGQDVWTAHWHQDDPGVVPAGCRNGAGGPTGVCVYEGDLFGPEWVGRVLNADAGANCVYAHTPVPDGGGYAMKPGMFLKSKSKGTDDEDARWFRPSDVCVATDGSVFVADWWDPGVGGHLAGDKKAYGRILRVAPKGRGLARPKIEVSTITEAFTALESPATSVRALAAATLRSRSEAAKAALQEISAKSSSRLRARALWFLTDSQTASREAVWREMEDQDLGVRVAAIRVERMAIESRSVTRESNWLLSSGLRERLLGSPPPEMRRELCLASRVKGALAHNTAQSPLAHIDRAQLAAGYTGGDRWLAESIGLMLEDRGLNPESTEVRRGASGRHWEKPVLPVLDSLRVDQPTDPLQWSRGYCEIACRMHTASSRPNLATRTKSTTLPREDRIKALEAIGFMKEREAGEAMLDLALGGPEDTRELAAWWVEHNDLDLWREYRLAEQLGPRGRADAEMKWTSGVLTEGAVEVDVDVSGSKTLWLVVNDGKRDNSCDWADWIEPVFVTPQGDVRLTDLDWESAKAGWGETHKNKNAAGGPLKFEGAVLPHGIGTHADSEIVYEVPEGATHFRALAALDDGGTTQGGHPDVEFQVYVDKRRDPDRWKPFERALTDASAKVEEVEAAAQTMAGDREGGLALLRLASTERLSPAATTAIERHIFANPDLSVRALASERFARAGAGAAVPSVAGILAYPGDPSRGEKVFFGDAAQCGTCHSFHGKGGDIGPDLTAISAKYGKKDILDAILNPSAAIAHGYDTYLVETKDGLLENGFVLSDGDQLVLKDTSGRRHVIPAAEIASKTKQKVSTMPDNVSAGLSAQDLADVAALLASNPRAPGKRLEPRALFDGKSLAGWTFFLDDPKAKMEDVWSVADGVLRCKGRPIGYIRTTEDFTDYVLTVEWRFDPALGAGNSGVLMRMTGADKVWPKSVEAQLNSGDAGDIWNIDEVPMLADPTRTQGRRTVKLQPSSEKPLGEWNRYVITLDGGELTLEVNGVKQNEAHWVERVPGKICLQSEGAAIEFRKVEVVPIER